MSTLAVNKATDVVGTSFYELMRLEAVKSATGTSVEFTSIPSWVKRITFMLNGVSTSSTSPMQIQLGDSGGYETSGYTGTNSTMTSGVASVQLSGGFLLTCNTAQHSAAALYSGSYILTLMNASTRSWAISGTLAETATARTNITTGNKSLSDPLDRIRIFIDGTATFDAGTINILLEGHNT